MEISLAAVLVLGGLVILRWVIIGLGSLLVLHSARVCPACFEPVSYTHLTLPTKA